MINLPRALLHGRLSMRFSSSALVGLAAQMPLNSLVQPATNTTTTTTMRRINHDFKLKEGKHILSPKNMLELPRPGAGAVNEAGDLVLVPVSKYSFEESRNHKFFYIASVDSPISPYEVPLTSGGDVFWLDSYTIAHVVSNNEDKVQELYAISVKVETQVNAMSNITPESPVLVGKLPTSPESPASNFVYRAGVQALVFSAYVYDDYNLTMVAAKDEAHAQRGNSALVYNGNDVAFDRSWDTWRGPKKQAIFVGDLNKTEGKWKLGSNFHSPLKVSSHSCPVEPFGGIDDFAVSNTALIYTTKDPKLLETMHTKQDIYIVDLKDGSKPKELSSGKQGITYAPAFSHADDKAAWLELAEDGYDADRAKIVIYDLTNDVRFTLAEQWDRSPSEIHFSHDDRYLFMAVGEHARVKVFGIEVPATPKDPASNTVYAEPKALTESGAVSGVHPLKDGRLVFTRSSFTSPNEVFLLTPSGHSLLEGAKELQLTAFSEQGLKYKHLDKGTELWWDGTKQKIQGWVLTPPRFKKGDSKKWPVVMLIHGGPQSALEDQWSTRWNVNVWASAGYVVFAPNPTGSTTFGQAFTDAVTGDWGGAPFDDMRAGWAKLLEEYPEIDKSRAIGVGGSYGGYAINWIQSNPDFGFGFKALVCHDGVFDITYHMVGTDIPHAMNHGWHGRPWEPETKALAHKMSPSSYVDRWSTPEMIIHGSQDYRVPETEGIAAFHALQQRGIPSRLLVFPDENHWVLKHGNSFKWHHEVFRWLDEFVGKEE